MNSPHEGKSNRTAKRGYRTRSQSRSSISFLRASKRRSHRARSIRINNILDTGISTAAENGQTDDKTKCVESGKCNVLLAGIPLALLDEKEPEESGEVETEA